MKKYFEINGYKFVTAVEFNTFVERRPEGIVKHTVTTNCLGGSNFYTKTETKESELLDVIALHERKATDFVLNYKTDCNLTPIEASLLSLGFTK